ncbi:HisA/HisF-related TIM barrel protein [Methylicorpusculum sp.]|uniref:HisA/HisF-related TIM barrel protein n=1 Tax=Methylicorpusculum sp. TaxID=2713644 RepID=UPI002730B66F|nr:HisA/HisF-related TIM barrel protein [Methylicorpusculum sp.]MDP2177045.1 HisA/HisF-related TIM barrel protein [Methylicorpusculum sp.]MDP3529921.1 HisA/HisF-related TIM barrel protein [Methylicorpusculum sp.]
MQIIPVIDLKDGCVVAAKYGQREHYQPIKSGLSTSHEAKSIIEALLKLHPFNLFYLADLDAITGNGSHQKEIKDILRSFPHIIFWIDQGYKHFEKLYSEFKNAIAVIGSESLEESDLAHLMLINDSYVLSLDHAKDKKLGAATVFEDIRFWPETIIIMNLYKVGSFEGPDFKMLKQFKTHYPDKQFVAAGGIRNQADLIALKKLDIHQALVASALHSGAIGKKELEHLKN